MYFFAIDGIPVDYFYDRFLESSPTATQTR